MWGVALLGAIFATLEYLGGHATVLLVLLVLAVFAHVAGNALGTRLRASGDQPLPGHGAGSRPPRRARAEDFAPTTRLSERRQLGKPTLIATLAGVVLGGTLGGYGLTLLMQRATLPTVMLAVGAAAVLGGIWAFLTASFVQVSLGAAWQATREEATREEAGRSPGRPD